MPSPRRKTPVLAEQQADAAPTAAELELQAFSYIVSHDLAASFRHVAEFSRLLLGELSEGLTSRQRSHAAHVGAATAKCQMMMEQLLAFSRAQQKGLRAEPQDATLAMQLTLLRLAGKARGAEVSIGPLGEVVADPDLLAIAFHHLMDNALKFHRPGEGPHVSVEAVDDDDTWRMRITDNGLGVEPAYRDKVFEMFQRLNGEDAYPGVGAGLAICRRIARRHGGEVRFLDCAQGACVELALPRAGARP
jgi:light-regulated signal transduction histidine kinase (bacteriophytochrome)